MGKRSKRSTIESNKTMLRVVIVKITRVLLRRDI